MVGHVNASRYIDWIAGITSEEICQKNQLEWLQINYLREIKWGEEVLVSSGIDFDDENIWHFEGENLSSLTVSFRATCRWKPQPT